jgi:hypothetical protein
MTVTRQTYTWPGRPEFAAGGSVTACAIPAKGEVGGAVTSDATLLDLIVQPFQKSVRRMNLNLNNRPLRAIAIAPDSPIAECDLWLGGDGGERSHHRISPGNPYIGGRDNYDTAEISIPDSIPCLDGDAADTVYWDADREVSDGSTMGGFDRIVGWPLRLELWQGDTLPIRSHKRAAHVAHAVFQMAELDTRSMYVCVNGRRRVSVIAALIGAPGESACTLQCYTVGGMKDTAGDATEDSANEILLPLNPAGDTSLIIGTSGGAVSSRIIEMDAIARPLLRVKLTSTAQAFQAQIHVRAED